MWEREVRFAALWDQLGRAQHCVEGRPTYELRSAPASVLSGLDVCHGVVNEQDGRAGHRFAKSGRCGSLGSRESTGVRLREARLGRADDGVELRQDVQCCEVDMQPCRRVRQKHDRNSFSNLTHERNYLWVDPPGRTGPRQDRAFSTVLAHPSSNFGHCRGPLLVVADRPGHSTVQQLLLERDSQDESRGQSQFQLHLRLMGLVEVTDHPVKIANDNANRLRAGRRYDTHRAAPTTVHNLHRGRPAAIGDRSAMGLRQDHKRHEASVKATDLRHQCSARGRRGHEQSMDRHVDERADVILGHVVIEQLAG